jgi:hypothetical protein
VSGHDVNEVSLYPQLGAADTDYPREAEAANQFPLRDKEFATEPWGFSNSEFNSLENKLRGMQMCSRRGKSDSEILSFLQLFS